VKLTEIGGIIQGRVYGNSEFIVHNVLPPEDARQLDLTFLFDASTKTNAGVIVSQEEIMGKSGIVVKDTREAMFLLLNVLARAETGLGVSARSVIEADAAISEHCTIEPFAVIRNRACIGKGTYIGAQCYIDEGVVIGENCRIYPSTCIYRHSQIGNFVVVESNSVIGKEGFGYIKKDRYERIRHIGGVIIGNYVEIGSGVTIDRGTIGNTVIGEGTKIDNQVHVAHNVRIGRNCIIMGQSGIAGSSKIGNNVIICGQVGISDHVEICDDAIVYAKSAVFKSIRKGMKYSGIPAREHSAVLRALARLYREKEKDE
jgi:UDP-3-O-[3-hydroxymyristoyl] glucosamine N-acyltransferase